MTDQQKQNNIIALPLDFSVIDVETTGLDFDFDHIIEISAIKYRNGEKFDEFTSLVRPPLREVYYPVRDTWERYYVPSYITAFTGISDEMLENAPEIRDVLPEFYNFIGNDILIGHNIPFDISFISAATEAAEMGNKPENLFVNTLRIAHKALPKMDHYRLENVALACNVEQKTAHRALADCEITALCFLKMRSDILQRMSEVEFVELFKKRVISYQQFIRSLEIEDVDEDSPIWKQTIVFTGTLEKMKRKDAMTLVAKMGGIPSNEITKETNYLVIGNADFVKSVKNGKTSKMKKAEKYAEKGCDIHIISENTFFEMIGM